jgi:hypothetical protein
MTCADLLRHRLYNQHVAGAPLKKPEDVVRWLGAVQAQDYPAAKWAVAQRARDVSDAGMDRAFTQGVILRTHVMRSTWHFVLPADIRWMLDLTAPRVNSACASYYRKLKLHDALFAKSNAVLAQALRGGKTLTRRELAAALQDAGITSPADDKIRLTFIVLRAELDAVICSGPKVDKQLTYALFDERVPAARPMAREEARTELAARYFRSHAPATARDFTWWSGLTAADSRAAVETIRHTLVSDEIEGKTYWRPKRLPSFDSSAPTAHLLTTYDECLVAYRDRAPLDRGHAERIGRDNGRTVAIDGRVAGTWKRAIEKGAIVLRVTPLSAFSRRDRTAVAAAVERYARFLELPVTVWFAR